jgi:hypothetical protein
VKQQQQHDRAQRTRAILEALNECACDGSLSVWFSSVQY